MAGIGTISDLNRYRMGISEYFIDKYPQYEDAIYELIDNLTKK